MSGGVVAASAPGKIILFGEHAVVYGEPSLSLAIDRRMHVTGEATQGPTTVNGEALDPHHHAYIHQALQLVAGGHVRLTTASELPSAGGVGSSAALSVAAVAVLLHLKRGTAPPLEDIARTAFEAEYATQGAASPNDTTVSTAGGAVLLSPTRLAQGRFLWRIERGERVWHAHGLDVPALPLVVANCGVRGRTAEQVAKVRRTVESDAGARDVVRAIGEITREGVQALAGHDLKRLGRLMNRNHEALHALGVDIPALARLVDAARKVPGTYGAKLTGAGGGGSMIALTERPDEVRRVLEGMGATAFRAIATSRGVEVRP